MSEFNDDFCLTCKGLATGLLDFDGISYYRAVHNLKYFYKFKEGLYKHFMEDHRDRLIEVKNNGV